MEKAVKICRSFFSSTPVKNTDSYEDPTPVHILLIYAMSKPRVQGSFAAVCAAFHSE